MDAKTAVWITKEPRIEHINAINWLNQVSDKNFYLIAVKLIKIDESNPAPVFSIICQPSEDAKKLGSEKMDLDAEKSANRNRRQASDTIIVPARKEGFDRVFLGEHCWYAIRISATRIPQLKYIAGYQVAPESAITHIAEIKDIIPADEEGKYKVIFAKPAKKIDPITMGSKTKIQGPAYCEFKKLETAKTVDDLLTPGDYLDDKTAA